MREPKYNSESGTKQGNWYLNRFEYFEFYGFEGELKFKIICLIACISSYLAMLNAVPIYLYIPLGWIVYISAITLYVLYKKTCKIHGYFLYPDRLVRKFKRYEKQIDMEDFDSVASTSEHK